MLIITADDYGKTKQATDCILDCFSKGRITSASAMVFMEDSERAASLALSTDLETGLHLNFTEPFSCSDLSEKVGEQQNRIISYLSRSKFAQVIYNPLLTDSFKSLFRTQQEEFLRLYKRPPDFINGHHHMHLCANVLMAKLIPVGSKIRGTFTFRFSEKDLFNLLYREILNFFISRWYVSTDGFFSIEPIRDAERIQNIIERAFKKNIEMEVHPENMDEFDFLLSDRYSGWIDSVQKLGFRHL